MFNYKGDACKPFNISNQPAAFFSFNKTINNAFGRRVSISPTYRCHFFSLPSLFLAMFWEEDFSAETLDLAHFEEKSERERESI